MNILVIAPHPDDEIIGVGGMIANRTKKGHHVYVCVVTRGCEPLFTEESVERVKKECLMADELLGVEKTFFLDFPAAMIETVPRYKLNNAIFDIIKKVMPDEVYLPHRGDMQLDHKMIVDSAMVALRPKYKHQVKRIYAYETLSETGWDVPNVSNDFIPNVYEDISEVMEKKLSAVKMFKSQISEFPNARSIEAIEALAKYRGCTVTLNRAESFMLIREIK